MCLRTIGRPYVSSKRYWGCWGDFEEEEGFEEAAGLEALPA
jgi:hypothetical protein